MSDLFPDPGSPDYVEDTSSSHDYMAQWRIREFLGGPTYLLPVGADGRPTDDDLLEAIAVVIDEDYLSGCTVEFRRMDSDEPWTLLGGSDEPARPSSAVFDEPLGALEELVADGLVFSAEQGARLARLRSAGGGSAGVPSQTSHRRIDQVDWLRSKTAIVVLQELLDGPAAADVLERFRRCHNEDWCSRGPVLDPGTVGTHDGLQEELRFILEDLLEPMALGAATVEVAEACTAWQRHGQAPPTVSTEEWCTSCACVHQIAGWDAADSEAPLPVPVLIDEARP